jgi:hypothetical protein
MSGQRDLRRLGSRVGDKTLIAARSPCVRPDGGRDRERARSPCVRPDERRERERERQAGTVWDADRQ